MTIRKEIKQICKDWYNPDFESVTDQICQLVKERLEKDIGFKNYDCSCCAVIHKRLDTLLTELTGGGDERF